MSFKNVIRAAAMALVAMPAMASADTIAIITPSHDNPFFKAEADAIESVPAGLDQCIQFCHQILWQVFYIPYGFLGALQKVQRLVRCILRE